MTEPKTDQPKTELKTELKAELPKAELPKAELPKAELPKLVLSKDKYYATGKRKSSIARVWLKAGTGELEVNLRKGADFFCRPTLIMLLNEPLELTQVLGRFDVIAKVCGGGLAGQAGAVRHGIAKALLDVDPQFRGVLKKAGMLTRDSRVKERKKYGQPGARKRFQFSKR
jgi:small subunit ribosomal protein S9